MLLYDFMELLIMNNYKLISLKNKYYIKLKIIIKYYNKLLNHYHIEQMNNYITIKCPLCNFSNSYFHLQYKDLYNIFSISNNCSYEKFKKNIKLKDNKMQCVLCNKINNEPYCFRVYWLKEHKKCQKIDWRNITNIDF